MAETSLVNVIAVHATASTAHPAIPAKLTNITQSAWNTSGFTTIGKVDSVGNDVDLGDSTFKLPDFTKEFEEVRAPRGNAPEDHILLSQRAAFWEFVCYGTPEALWALDSNASITSNVFTTTDTTTPRTVAVEYGGGLGLVYYPQCVVTVLGNEGGFGSGGVIQATVQVMPERTSSLDAGFDLEWYQ